MPGFQDAGILPVHTPNNKIEFVPITSIEYVESNGSTSHIFLENRRKIISTERVDHSLAPLIRQKIFIELKPLLFVNIHHIDGVLIKEDTVSMRSGKTFVPSKRKKLDLFSMLKLAPKNIPTLIVQCKEMEEQVFYLDAGRQTIGRKGASGEHLSDIQIETADNTLSRQHLVINCKISKKNCEYTVSLFKENVNTTTIDNKKMEPDIAYSLADKTNITCGITNMIFRTNNDNTKIVK